MSALRSVVGGSLLLALAACSGAADEETGTSEDAVQTAETITFPTGTVPRKLRVTTAATQCPLPTDCNRAWTDRFVEDVFVKFFRSPGVQTDAIPGTGIGLAISKAIVEAHGGTIDLDSMVGVGTTFEIRLPLAGQRVAHSA